MNQEIEINIDQLLLDGFSANNGQLIASSIKNELTMIFKEKGLPSSISEGSNIGRIETNDIKITSNSKPNEIGFLVANSVYNGL